MKKQNVGCILMLKENQFCYSSAVHKVCKFLAVMMETAFSF